MQLVTSKLTSICCIIYFDVCTSGIRVYGNERQPLKDSAFAGLPDFGAYNKSSVEEKELSQRLFSLEIGMFELNYNTCQTTARIS